MSREWRPIRSRRANDRALDVKVLGAAPLQAGLVGAAEAGELTLQWTCGGPTVDRQRCAGLLPSSVVCDQHTTNSLIVVTSKQI